MPLGNAFALRQLGTNTESTHLPSCDAPSHPERRQPSFRCVQDREGRPIPALCEILGTDRVLL